MATVVTYEIVQDTLVNYTFEIEIDRSDKWEGSHFRSDDNFRNK